MRRWNPWKALAARPDVVLRQAALGGTLIGFCDAGEGRGPPTITLARTLDRVERNAVLAHELVHLERGGGIDFAGAPRSWRAVVEREEHIVDREVARRLVPLQELRRFANARAEAGEAVTVDDVMEEWDVPHWVARDAVEAFLVSRRRATPPRA
jgi:hypothetical protein